MGQSPFHKRTPTSLDVFRLRALTTEPLPAVFVLEPHMHAAAGVVAGWDPAATLQVLGGASRPHEASVRETLLYAISMGARSIVVCCEDDAPPHPGLAVDAAIEACRGLLEDDTLGPMLRAHAVELEVLWFDRVEGDIHRWDGRRRAFTFLTDPDIDQMLAELAARGGPAPPAPA